MDIHLLTINILIFRFSGHYSGDQVDQFLYEPQPLDMVHLQPRSGRKPAGNQAPFRPGEDRALRLK
jgi:hypothetical protein